MSLALVMPMAGRGSRFSRGGVGVPKPLIELHGRPFFWWAAESVRRAVHVHEMVFVVLDEHRESFAIDQTIANFYPEAQIVGIEQVTSGAAETARIGVAALSSGGPMAVNDCDHAFMAPGLAPAVLALDNSAAGALLCFRSQSPAYSYVELGGDGEIVGTVEKQVVSPFAIAGCYLFGSAASFTGLYEAYRAACPYDELFVSGLFNLMAERGQTLLKVDAEHHCSFGTPEEYERANAAEFRQYLAWI